MTKVKHADRLDALEVLSLSDEAAERWLMDHQFTGLSWHAKRESTWHPIASFSYARRSSKRLRVAVARYGTHVRTLRKILVSGTTTERLGVLSNPLIGPKFFAGDDARVLTLDEAMAVLKNYRSRPHELAVFSSNSGIDPNWLCSTIKSWSAIGGLDEEGLLALLDALPANRKLISERDNLDLTERPPWYSISLDKEYGYEELSATLANFLITAPITAEWASAILRVLPIVLIPIREDMDFGLLDRWRDPAPDEDEGEDYIFVMLRKEIAQGILDRDARLGVDRSYPIVHSDAEVRQCFYQSLAPEKLFEGIAPDDLESQLIYAKSELTAVERRIRILCDEYLALDDEKFIEGIIDNMHFWRSKEARLLLRDIAHERLSGGALYSIRWDYHSEHSPWLFDDETGSRVEQNLRLEE